MLLLIVSDRDRLGAVKEDVRRHKNGVIKESRIDIIGVGLGFILKLSHSRKLTEGTPAVEYPRKLCVA